MQEKTFNNESSNVWIDIHDLPIHCHPKKDVNKLSKYLYFYMILLSKLILFCE